MGVTVCMPKAKCAFRRSNPFELKLFEAQDQCNIRAHTKFQLPKSRWSLMTMGQNRGILCSERVFCALEVEVEGEDQCAREKIGLNQNDASDHFLSAKRLHTRPSSCSTRARLVATGAIRLRFTVKT